MHPLLSSIESAADLHAMTVAELKQVADEIRDALCSLLNQRTAHFASNLGVVELCLGLHSVFDFRRDRLIWDTGHQIYPHKLVTGRYHEFASMRTRNGLMGYPNPKESEYDLFMTGHAGCSLSTVFGMKVADDLMDQEDRRAVAVIGDGAFPSGIVYEAMNNMGGLKKKLLVVLNDNKMSICPRVGGLSSYLDRLRVGSLYTGLKRDVSKILNKVPLFGDPAERFFAQLKEAVKGGMYGGMLLEALGFKDIGPIGGHNIQLLRKYLEMVKDLEGPVLLHVVTEKGHGFKPAEEDPAFFHTPPAFEHENGVANVKLVASSKTYTHYASEAIYSQIEKDGR
ncbi:MAG: 1-deoxy-D-xylulose-5-phosphate synthase, partial [Planctomycetaceae bacterium]|nr:1-deoxy-D-xylulose-5-phosphate synthase [Planctomycetaceae bacterium]